MSSTPHTQRDAQPNDYLDGPRLLADVGGTNARFALERAPGQIDTIIVLRCADYEEFADACEAYLAQAGNPPVRHAAIDIANPVDGDEVKMTNHKWQFSIEATRRRLNFDTLLVVNDFTALAMALPHLEQSHVQQIGGGNANGQHGNDGQKDHANAHDLQVAPHRKRSADVLQHGTDVSQSVERVHAHAALPRPEYGKSRGF